MRVIVAFLFAVLVSGCCYEPSMSPNTNDVVLAQLPSRVRESFERGYHPSEVTRVQRVFIKSRCTGNTDRYRFHLASGQTITLDKDGRLSKWSGYFGE